MEKQYREDISEYAAKQRRMRLARLMAQAYREEAKRVQEEGQASYCTYNKDFAPVESDDKTRLYQEEGALMEQLISLLEESIERQEQILPRIRERLQANYQERMPEGLEPELEKVQKTTIGPIQGLYMFLSAISLTAILLFVRAIVAAACTKLGF